MPDDGTAVSGASLPSFAVVFGGIGSEDLPIGRINNAYVFGKEFGYSF